MTSKPDLISLNTIATPEFTKEIASVKNKSAGSGILIYISGPITGYVDLNKPAFDKMARLLDIVNGLSPQVHCISPLEITPPDQQAGKNWEDFMRDDLEIMMSADVLVMLPDWKSSSGAITEYFTARLFITTGLNFNTGTK